MLSAVTLNGLRAAGAPDQLRHHDALANRNRGNAEFALRVRHCAARRALHGHDDIGKRRAAAGRADGPFDRSDVLRLKPSRQRSAARRAPRQRCDPDNDVRLMFSSPWSDLGPFGGSRRTPEACHGAARRVSRNARAPNRSSD